MTEHGKADWIVSDAGLILVGGHCADCGRKFFPEKPNCPNCGSDQVSPAQLSRIGRLYSYSTIHSAPRGFHVPYTVGFVDLDDDVRVFGQIEGGDTDLVLETPMEPVLGVIRTDDDGDVQSYKFRRATHVS